MTATVTITTTPDTSSTPPRMKLNFTAYGSPAVSSLTISRIDPDGVTRPVRTSDGNPLPVSPGPARTVTNGVTTASSTTVTSATAAFTSADVGASISGGSIPAGSWIVSVTSGTAVVISAAATASATGVSVTITQANNGTLSDYEIPYGQNVTYTVAEGNAPTASAFMDVLVPWLTHLGVPSRSVTMDFRPGTNANESWAIDQGVFTILGRDTPIVITGGARQAPSSVLIAGTDVLSDRDALKALLKDGSPLLLNVSPTLGLGLNTAYIAVGTVTPARAVDVGTVASWLVSMPYQVVSRPAGGTKAGVAWSDVAVTYTTWSSIPAGKTWAQIAAGT